MSEGYIYVLRDHLNNNLIKVGFTKDPIRRWKQLYNTSTALPMTLYYLWKVDDMRKAEKIAHIRLEDHRVNPRREFFEIAPLPHFNEFERTDYDISCTFLDVLIELIETDFRYGGINYQIINNIEEIM
ncbi:GIY-YIG nuclease family protein (plasmid) [Acinetobacter baumannii]|uniref:GIY-YIG nuclease family protein n=1 Tax=Acinetobacter pittii TaxID=48296 RepID=UPI0022EC2F69|nr:GIY-YIG nuclease family protein [Acinetobacter pittii]MDA5049568.1 GIY-YIG nuclease family protein [Acinetobacter baumannii]MDV7708525.1 GIY-YIG nuclease family protein [Acinetobacter pittii]MDV7762499.1 GIY-YIG nuclease family protein [Acinetobacter pittii]